MTRPVVVIPADHPPMVGRSPCLNRLRDIAEVVLYDNRPQTEEEKLRRLEPADILLNSRGFVKFSRDVIGKLPKLKMIAVCGIGYDAIDLAAATDRGIVVSNIPGKTAEVVAEHALALMLSVARRIPRMTTAIRMGEWPGELGISLRGLRLGVVGTGHIGQQLIRLGHAIGMETVAWSFHPAEFSGAPLNFRYVSWDELLSTSDVISIHVRLSDQTRGLIGQAELGRMKRGAILINTARGPIVQTEALVAALNSEHLFGAGIDVYDFEPMPADHPLMHCPSLALTPHSADQTQEGLDILTLGCVENIRAFLSGRPTNVVNRDVLTRDRIRSGNDW